MNKKYIKKIIDLEENEIDFEIINNSFSKNVYNKHYVIYECKKCGKEIKQLKKSMIIPFTEKTFLCKECKRKETNIEKFGIEFPQKLEKIKQKQKETNLKKYGSISSAQNEKVKQKQKETNLKKYGSISPLQNEEIKQKLKETFIKKYGEDNPSKIKEIKKKREKTNLEKYRSKTPMENEEIKRKAYPFNNNFKVLQKANVTPLFTKEEYKGSKKIYYPWKCKKCGTEFKSRIENGHLPRCPQCFPKSSSMGEIEVAEYIKSLGIEIIRNSRELIYPYEIDIYLPEYKIGIEYNGLYWHNGKDKFYHQNKVKLCKEKGISLITIFEDEWNEITKKNIYDFIFNDYKSNDLKWYRYSSLEEKFSEPEVYFQDEKLLLYDCGKLL